MCKKQFFLLCFFDKKTFQICSNQQTKKLAMPKIDTGTIVNVLIALVIFKAIDKLFLEKAMAKIGTFDALDPDNL